jgi:hypothetical protein
MTQKPMLWVEVGARAVRERSKTGYCQLGPGSTQFLNPTIPSWSKFQVFSRRSWDEVFCKEISFVS